MASLTTASSSLELEISVPKMLTSKEELEMMRRAYARDQSSFVLLNRLVSMLVRLDHFEEAISLLEANDLNDFRRLSLLYTALLSRETNASNRYAERIALRAVDMAVTPVETSQVLADLAKVELRLGDAPGAEEHLREALHLSPGNKDAYKRLVKLFMDRDPEEALSFAQSMVKKGIVHARVLGSIPMILTRMGRFDEAREAEAFDEFHLAKEPAAPAGWSSLKEFNDALADEILNHPDMRYERYGSASTKTWRVDDPLLHRSRIFPQLQQIIQSEIVNYAEQLSDDEHPLVKARPAHALLRNWCVVTQGEGHETWHVHQGGWLSGVYYIHVQDHIANGTGKEGCISFGMSNEFVGDEASALYGEKIIRPRSGLFMIFPSHSFHRTYPHYGPGHRICFAFDVIPTK